MVESVLTYVILCASSCLVAWIIFEKTQLNKLENMLQQHKIQQRKLVTLEQQAKLLRQQLDEQHRQNLGLYHLWTEALNELADERTKKDNPQNLLIQSRTVAHDFIEQEEGAEQEYRV